MNFGEIFRSVIGFPRRDNFPPRPRRSDEDNNSQQPFDFEFFGAPNFSEVDPSHRHGDAPGFDERLPGMGLFSGNMFDVFRHFDDMFKDFEKMTMGEAIEGGGFAFGGPHRPESGSLRDRMLKEPDSEAPPRPPPPDFGGQAPPRPPPPNFYGRSSPYESYSDHERRDTDLDEEIRKGNLDIVFGNRADMSTKEFLRPYEYKDSPRADPGRSFKSVSVRTYRSADGRVEERKSIQDGRGNDETTITRSIGEQEYSKTTKRDYTGAQTVKEDFKNMDEKDKEMFNSMWRSSQNNLRGDIMHRDPGVIDAETRSIFKNLFGQSFPGFPSDLS